MKDLLLIYKLYLQTLLNVKEFKNKYGDEDLLPIFEEKVKELIKDDTRTFSEKI